MTGAIILAAGSSSRLGTPKQTILYEGKTLLQRAAEAAQGAGCDPVIIVLGAHENAILAHFSYKSAIIVHNYNWHEGMGTSIAVGMDALLQVDNTVDTVIIMVCDQPFADAALLRELIEHQKQTGKGIAASAYADTMGVPALFDKKYFNTLMELGGDEGAKKIMLLHKEDVTLISFEKGVVDIDTVEDVEEFREGESEDVS
jgi:molybdenum cofactor cytidylyltransferase